MKPKQQTGNVNATNVADSYIVHSLASVKKGYRHTYHVMPPVGWMNDPNGFCYAFGKYQLFFQFYPYGAAWNSMLGLTHTGQSLRQLKNWLPPILQGGSRGVRLLTTDS